MQTETGTIAPATRGWQARWYLWDGGFLAFGRADGVVPPHAHHAIQIVIGLDGPVGLRGEEGPTAVFRGGIVAADVEHQFEPMGSLIAIMLVDPESHEGRWLSRSLSAPITEISATRMEAVTAALEAIHREPPDAPETARMVHALVRGLCAGPPPLRALDERVRAALEHIHRMDTDRLSLEEVARTVYLSPSRFAHLFRDEVGLPFRRYLLWRRLTRAMLAVGRGSTLSAAAHACGFSDSAHLTRTCYQMLGLPPSLLLRAGEFYEIPAPFEG